MGTSMRRTNIYLPEGQVRVLQGLARDRQLTMSELIRQAVNEWLKANGAEPVVSDEWRRRLGGLLDERARVADRLDIPDEEADRLIEEEIAAVRAERRARRP